MSFLDASKSKMKKQIKKYFIRNHSDQLGELEHMVSEVERLTNELTERQREHAMNLFMIRCTNDRWRSAPRYLAYKYSEYIEKALEEMRYKFLRSSIEDGREYPFITHSSEIMQMLENFVVGIKLAFGIEASIDFYPNNYELALYSKHFYPPIPQWSHNGNNTYINYKTSPVIFLRVDMYNGFLYLEEPRGEGKSIVHRLEAPSQIDFILNEWVDKLSKIEVERED